MNATPKLPRDCDVAIVGAGVAGLSALRILQDHGLSAHVFEARDRIGGRIFTLRDPRMPLPIELGAEFVHGSAPALVGLLADARLTAYVIEGERWRSRNRRLTRFDDFWKTLDTVMRRLPDDGPDRSFDEFLSTAPGGPSAADARKLARAFVENFQGADASRVSALAMADGGSPGDDPDEQRMMRIADGYDSVPEWIARDYRDRISTGAVVESVGWESENVELKVRHTEDDSLTHVSARAAVITVPLGVLLAREGEAGAIRFSPPLDPIERIRDRLTMGSARRVVVLFRERWWEKKLKSVPDQASLDKMSFVHGETGDFPVWWTLHPAHVTAMVGWVGGPAAAQLAGIPDDEIRDRAIASLAAKLGVTRKRVASQVMDSWTHDWDSDPFSRGAYSYALVGGSKSATGLGRTMEGTLWLAGEAADAEGRNGTVHGAIESGRRAAHSILRAVS
jgi:monoamine oxidase